MLTDYTAGAAFDLKGNEGGERSSAAATITAISLKPFAAVTART